MTKGIMDSKNQILPEGVRWPKPKTPKKPKKGGKK